VDLDSLIDRLEDLLDHSVRIPYTSRVVMNEDEYLRLIDQIRINVPEEIRKARQIEADRDTLLKQAQEQAEAMIAKGRETATGLVSDHALVSQAQERSKEILGQADKQAAVKRADADAYALEVLERIAGQLEGFLRTVDNGIQLLGAGESASGGGGPLGDGGVEPRIVGENPRNA
jgi:cell division septum initiation protein DivIVA